MIPMKNSEVLDRWTILQMKSRFNDQAKVELALYNKEVELILDNVSKANRLEFICSLANLMEANAKIWNLEASIRKEFSGDIEAQGELTLGEIGKRSVLIREHNALRIRSKTVIDKIFGEIVDVKVDHVSAQEK